MTVDEYINSIPDDRRQIVNAIREVILQNLPEGVVEVISYGMIGYVIPHTVYPKGYHCNPKLPLPIANLGNQKGHVSLYLMCVYGNPKETEWFQTAWRETGRKLDMGKACVRIKKLENAALDVIAETFRRFNTTAFIGGYEHILSESKTYGNKKG